jgi:hypothetical protein
MAITLNHTIIPASDKEAAARLFAHLFRLSHDASSGDFSPVMISDTLTFLFATDTDLESHHYAFHVTEVEFDSILHRVRETGLP